MWLFCFSQKSGLWKKMVAKQRVLFYWILGVWVSESGLGHLAFKEAESVSTHRWPDGNSQQIEVWHSERGEGCHRIYTRDVTVYKPYIRTRFACSDQWLFCIHLSKFIHIPSSRFQNVQLGSTSPNHRAELALSVCKIYVFSFRSCGTNVISCWAYYMLPILELYGTSHPF